MEGSGDKGSAERHVPADLPLGNSPWRILNRREGGSGCRRKCEGKNPVPTETEQRALIILIFTIREVHLVF